MHNITTHTSLDKLTGLSKKTIALLTDNNIACCEDILYNKEIFGGITAKIEFSAAKAVFKDVSEPTLLLVRLLKGKCDTFGEEIYMQDIDERAIKVINTLDAEEADLIRYYLGYTDGVKHTIVKCDEYTQKNKGKAARIIGNAIRKLRHHSRYNQIILKD